MIEKITGYALMHSIENNISHWHDSIEIIEVIKGRFTCAIEGKRYILEEGDICIINSCAIHNLKTDEDNSYLKAYQISRELFTRSENIFRKYLEKMINDERFAHTILRKNDSHTEKMRNMLESIYDFVTNKPQAYELAVVGIVHLLLQKIYNYYDNSKKINIETQDSFLYREMSRFIYSNYMYKISLEDIANKANVSKSKAINIFNKFAERSPVDFLNMYRIKVASEKLKDTNMTISEIAMDTGFNQASYFNRVFLREYNMTPSEYRKSMV